MVPTTTESTTSSTSTAAANNAPTKKSTPSRSVTKLGKSMIQRKMKPCPKKLNKKDPVPSGWKAYQGDPNWFHCGFRGILEDKVASPKSPQNECFYDHSGTLVDDNHKYAGCKGTPNQYDSKKNPILHALIDSGGIVRAGLPAFLTSMQYDVDQTGQQIKKEARKGLDWRNWLQLGR